MARTDKNDDAPEEGVKAAPAGAAGPGSDEDDGYRRTRRQQLRQEEEPKDKPSKKADKAKPASGYDAFMDEHWESWLRPVLGLVLLAVGYVAYKWEILPEYTAGLLCGGGLVALTIYGTAEPAYNLIRDRRYQMAFFGLCLVWGFAAGFPTLRKAYPRQVLGETALTDEKKTEVVKLKGPYAGPFDITVSGRLESSGSQAATAVYELTASGGGGQDKIEGDLEYSVHQTRSRRGGGHWTENNNQVVHRLSGAVKGLELTFTTDSVDKLLADGLHIAVHPQTLNPWIFWGLGLFVVLMMGVVEATVGDSKEKTNLVMASMVTLVFSYRFYERATTTNLVRPAVEALFVALISGGIGGTFVGWLVRKLSGRDKLKPARPEKEDKEKDA